MCNMNLEEDERIEKMIISQLVKNDKGDLVYVGEILKDAFTFYKDEQPLVTYYAIGKHHKIYYNLGMHLSDYCKEITYKEFLDADNNIQIATVCDIDEVFLIALYNLYKKNKNLNLN